jgi:C4-dicarboxylate-specific signal transduction histidine kinase
MALIDQVRLANRELAAQRLEILHTEKLRALGRMAGEIAHEINNPLAIIHGNSVLMKSILQSGGDSTQLPQLAASVEQTAMRISRIVKGMKRVARDSRHDPMKETPFSSILQDTYALCEERVRGRTLELKFPEIGDDLILKCRSSEICQVLLNLVGNALDAVEGQDSPKIAVDATLRGSNLEIGVTDSGPGIPKELRARILEPFFTTKESGKGMGLGLSISRAIIEGHGGSLWLDDSSQDTRFVFTLPVSS